jgi:hypothetical protein
MACGACGQKRAGTVEYDFIYTNVRGEQTTYDNQFKARARVLREGGTWAKVPKAPAA